MELNWSNTTYCSKNFRISVDRTSETFCKVTVQRMYEGNWRSIRPMSRGFRGVVKGVPAHDRSLIYAEELFATCMKEGI